jgi:hypothetical protein
VGWHVLVVDPLVNRIAFDAELKRNLFDRIADLGFANTCLACQAESNNPHLNKPSKLVVATQYV